VTNDRTTPKTDLPPGQVLTRKFPVVGEQQPPPEALDLEAWSLVVDGLVEEPLQLSYREVMALPQSERVEDIHCVTGWSHLAMHLGGFPLDLLLHMARPLAAARFVRFEAFSERHHDTSLPLELARQDTWLVHHRDGEPLSPAHGFPLRTVTPSRYFYKSLKWVRRIELMARDRLGFWERDSSYHNGADPWPGDQRFTTGSLQPKQLELFREATNFTRYRSSCRVFLGLDLRGWRPRCRDLRELQLKGCNLAGADLAGCDLRGANLSLSSLVGANLESADLRGADLEGVDFTSANLENADLRQCLFSAARFFSVGEGAGGEARVQGMRIEGSRGLLEDQEAFLRGASLEPEGKLDS
jgi:DMSO/TMAO reductase YedYZ molybdopterin-dependent catalytic subunit